MVKLETVFWDVDGTLADTEMYGHRIAFNNAFSDMSLKWSWDLITYSKLLKVQGGSQRIKYYAISLGINLEENTIQTIHERKQFHYEQQIKAGKVPLRKGVPRLLKELKRNGVSQWIVTTSGRKAVDSLISALFPKNSSPFQGAITYEDVSQHKPHPEAYLKAITKSGANPNSTIVIEDSKAGLLSAKYAFLKCLLTLSPWNKTLSSEMKFASAILDHLGDFNNPCSVLWGQHCPDHIVDLKYLETIINMDKN